MADNPFSQFDAPHEAVNPFSRFDVDAPTPPREKPTAPVDSFLGRVGKDVLGAINAGGDWATRQHNAVGEAVSEPFEQAWNAPAPANTPENRGAAPPWLYGVLTKAQRVVDLGMATLPAAIGAASAAVGLDPHAVNQAINDYLPGVIGVEGLHGAGEARPAEDAGTATLKNIAEGKPAGAPRPEAAPALSSGPSRPVRRRRQAPAGSVPTRTRRRQRHFPKSNGKYAETMICPTASPPPSWRCRRGASGIGPWPWPWVATWFGARKAPFALAAPKAAAGYFQRQETRPKSPKERWREKLRRERKAASSP